MLSHRYIHVLTHAMLKYVKVGGWVGMISYLYIHVLTHALLMYVR